MKQKLVMTITLLTFIALVSGFVMYRSGLFEETFQPGSNGGVVKTTKTDKILNKDTTKRVTVIPSSKVIIMTDQGFVEPTKIKQFPIDSTDTKRLELMGGSKSVILFKPNKTADTTKIKSKQK